MRRTNEHAVASSHLLLTAPRVSLRAKWIMEGNRSSRLATQDIVVNLIFRERRALSCVRRIQHKRSHFSLGRGNGLLTGSGPGAEKMILGIDWGTLGDIVRDHDLSFRSTNSYPGTSHGSWGEHFVTEPQQGTQLVPIHAVEPEACNGVLMSMAHGGLEGVAACRGSQRPGMFRGRRK